MIYGGIRGRVSRKVERNEEVNLPSLFAQLELELKASKVPGIGLAGVQIGLPMQIAIVRIGEEKVDLWNPKIIEMTGLKFYHEGCLSYPGQIFTVKRASDVVFENGDGRRFAVYGLTAQCIQHEIDHLQGLTIEDRRAKEPGRNEPCLCGSTKKWKKCCGG